MARAVAQLGDRVSIYTTNQDGPGILPVPIDRPVWREGVEVRYFPIQPPRFWSASRPLARCVAAGRSRASIWCTFITSIYFTTGDGLLLPGPWGVPYLIQPHGALDPFIHRRHRGRKRFMEWGFQNRNIRKAAACFTTAAERELAAPFTFGTPGVVVPLGMDAR